MVFSYRRNGKCTHVMAKIKVDRFIRKTLRDRVNFTVRYSAKGMKVYLREGKLGMEELSSFV